jgi:hypothetical protein
LCVGCDEIDVEKSELKRKCFMRIFLVIIEKDENEGTTKNKKKDRSKKQKGKKERENEASNCHQLENKLKWAVDEVN